jgi:hypothetical protein
MFAFKKFNMARVIVWGRRVTVTPQWHSDTMTELFRQPT